MHQRAIQPALADARWPMTSHALTTLVEEIERLRRDVELEAGAPIEADEVVRLPMARAARRLDALTAVLDLAESTDQAGRAVIGRRVTIREGDGESVSFALVFPGDGDPAQGWISADAPLGAAILGHGAGDAVEVIAPAGRRIVTLVDVA